ncbi:MAG: hypothetical protein M0P43_03775 [Arcobacteraceae bacterium]|nr:hypothetical protein [Arcobacteraceae bacterium]
MSTEIFLIATVSFMTGIFAHMFFSSKKISNLTSEISRIRLASELTVATYPYEESYGSNSLISDERKAEIGYKYQLFVSGVPCFEPHKVKVKTLEKKEVSPEKIEKALGQVIGIIEAIAAKNPAIQALKSAPNVLK